MTKVDRYPNWAEQMIRDQARHQLSYGDIEVQAIIDPVGNHYQLILWYNNNDSSRVN